VLKIFFCEKKQKCDSVSNTAAQITVHKMHQSV